MSNVRVDAFRFTLPLFLLKSPGFRNSCRHGMMPPSPKLDSEPPDQLVQHRSISLVKTFGFRERLNMLGARKLRHCERYTSRWGQWRKRARGFGVRRRTEKWLKRSEKRRERYAVKLRPALL
jgi:hypothetical protein